MFKTLGDPFELAARYEQGKAIEVMTRVVRGWAITPHERRAALVGLTKYKHALAERFGVSVESVVELADNMSDPADELFGFGIAGDA